MQNALPFIFMSPNSQRIQISSYKIKGKKNSRTLKESVMQNKLAASKSNTVHGPY